MPLSTGGLHTARKRAAPPKTWERALKAVNITAFGADKWSNRIAAIDEYVAGKVEHITV